MNKLGILVLVIVLLALRKGYTQDVIACQEMIYESYVLDDRERSLRATNRLKELYRQSPSDSLLFHLTYAQQTNLGFAWPDDYHSKQYEEARRNAEQLIQTPAYKSYGHTFLASLYAIQMGRSTMSAMFLAPKNKSELKLALDADETNPLAWLQFGGYKFYAPGFFGGDLEEAIEAFERSVSLYEEKSVNRVWDYLGVLSLLRRAYQKAGKLEEANDILEKAKSIEPRLKWIKNS